MYFICLLFILFIVYLFIYFLFVYYLFILFIYSFIYFGCVKLSEPNILQAIFKRQTFCSADRTTTQQ